MPNLHPDALYRRWPFKAIVNKLRPRACILAYHRVALLECDPFGQSVTPQNFTAHLQHLRQHYHVESLDSLLDQLPRAQYPDRTVAVTFDDGYVDNYTTAYPIAAAYNVPLTVFVTVQPLLDGERFWWDRLVAGVLRTQEATLSLNVDGQHHQFSVQNQAERVATCRSLQPLLRKMSNSQREAVLEVLDSRDKSDPCGQDTTTRPLTVDELLSLAKLPGVRIGAHTMTHPVLSQLTSDEQRNELQQSRAQLAELLGEEIAFISYPYGKASDITPTTTKLASDVGYRAALTTLPAPLLPTAQVYRLPRLTGHNWSEIEFKQRLDAIFG